MFSLRVGPRCRGGGEGGGGLGPVLTLRVGARCRGGGGRAGGEGGAARGGGAGRGTWLNQDEGTVVAGVTPGYDTFTMTPALPVTC